MAYTAPKNLLEVMQLIEYEEALLAGDPRFVETEAARGSERTFTRLARKFGWDPDSDKFYPPSTKHVLFFGHVGSGKTTELRRYKKRLDESRRFLVIEVDVIAKLDRNNLQYADVLMAMAEVLLEELQADGHLIDEDDLGPLREWFAQATVTSSRHRELSAEVKAGAEGKGGIPGLISLFALFTTTFKTGSSIKKEWREEVRNRFSTLAAAFNGLLRSAEQALKATGRAERIVFMLDGTDKMRGADTEQFFVLDAEQLLGIEAMVIYTAPLHLKYGGRLVGKLDADLVLPMIKLEEPGGGRADAGWNAMRQVLLRRADASLFAGDAEVERLVESSGGHPRELLRLLKLACEYADDHIDAVTADKAIAQLAAEYRHLLEPEDYARLKRIDTDPVHGGNDDRTRRLLYCLALLEYNDGSWRRSHPVVRRLEGYVAALAQEPHEP